MKHSCMDCTLQRVMCEYLYFIFLLHPIDNTLVVQYQLVQGCLKYVYMRKKLGWRRAHYSKTNYGPLTRLTLFYYSFVIH